MIRLRIMPLVKDFGEFLEHPLKQLSPKTNLVFTRDYRIFNQFENFPDTEPAKLPKPHIKPLPLPPELTVGKIDDEEGEIFIREGDLGYEIVYVYARQLKTLIIPEDTTPINKAIKAYIDTLPDDTPIIMDWE